MADLINLTKARKARARQAARFEASENGVKFGRTREEKDLARAKLDKLKRETDAHKREP